MTTVKGAGGSGCGVGDEAYARRAEAERLELAEVAVRIKDRHVRRDGFAGMDLQIEHLLISDIAAAYRHSDAVFSRRAEARSNVGEGAELLILANQKGNLLAK